MNTGWVYLYAGVLIAGVAMPFAKLSNGFERLDYGIPALIFSFAATICWILSMKHLSLSTAWLIWLGMDAIIMIVVSYFLFHESFSVGKILCMALIIIGCVGLNLLEMKRI